MSTSLDVAPGPVSTLDELRGEVRAFLAGQTFTPRCDPWVRGFDPGFSRAVGERGWIGMTWPTERGGGGSSNVERWVVAEELLRAGAPVAGHWTADRQTGPSLLRFGTPALQAELLPAIRRGEVVVGLGISESEAGSDLAALRTGAKRVDGGWEISGTKIWSSSAHHATHVYVLARTDSSGSRHDGMTEFLIDAGAAGLEVRPILDLTGEHHFNEMHFDRVFAPDARVLGEVGAGWKQITDQLAFERGGPDRYLSTYPLVRAMLRRLRRAPDRAATERLGALTARLVGLRRLGLELAHELDSGRAPSQKGARLKLLGTLFEQDVVETARYVLDVCGAEPEDLALLHDAIQVAPGATIRGGTSEIMRTVVARAEVGR
ncbi:acyl-CoA dehydrogenase family protein [Nocardioides sp. SOB44]|uniref:Acyl-CoA dehydrogenase family protein n=1 Tax=Nocardioides cremeus TaxID=3058044 RepID=A0ABT8TN77_9ACTN|nr:acyl-CoA dehydrogenase family protein [Nocardioides cremeus]MDO3395405.1 acyl-CoA dehydrogenase family protein [Nocardioides cremeus]